MRKGRRHSRRCGTSAESFGAFLVERVSSRIPRVSRGCVGVYWKMLNDIRAVGISSSVLNSSCPAVPILGIGHTALFPSFEYAGESWPCPSCVATKIGLLSVGSDASGLYTHCEG